MPRNKTRQTRDPGVTDDQEAGFLVLSRWINETDDKEFVCLDKTTGAAVWKETTGGGSGSQLTTEEVEDIAGALVENVTGTHTGITITYQDVDGDIDFIVDHDTAANFVQNEHLLVAAIDHDLLLNFASNEHFTMLDEDDLISNSDTQAATQQSIKAYIATQLIPSLTDEEVEDIVGGMVGGASIQTGIAVTYDDVGAELDFILDFGITNDKVLQVDGTPNSAEYARFTASGLEGRTEAEFKVDFNLEIGTDILAEQTIGIADNNLVEIDSVSVASGEYGRFTVNGLESRSTAEVLSDIGAAASAHSMASHSDDDTYNISTTGTASVGALTATGITIGLAVISEAELEILDGAIVTTTELNIIGGGTSATATTLVNADRMVINDAGVMKQVAVSDLEPYLEGVMEHDSLQSPTIAGHDTTGTGANLTELTDGSTTTLHAHAGGGGASLALDNLAAVQINTTLVSDTDITDDLGTGDVRWKDAWVETISAGLTATDVLKLRGRDVDGTVYVDILTITSANTVTADLNAIVTIGGNEILSSASTVSILTDVGTITTGVWDATTVAVAAGGTGAETFTDGGVLVGATTGAFEVTDAGTVGSATLLDEFLHAKGSGNNPDYKGIEQTVSITIENPLVNDNITLRHFNAGATIQEVHSLCTGGTSVAFNLYMDATRTTETTQVFTSDQTITAGTGMTRDLPNTAAIEADDILFIDLSAVSGTPTEFHVTIRYTTT